MILWILLDLIAWRGRLFSTFRQGKSNIHHFHIDNTSSRAHSLIPRLKCHFSVYFRTQHHCVLLRWWSALKCDSQHRIAATPHNNNNNNAWDYESECVRKVWTPRSLLCGRSLNRTPIIVKDAIFIQQPPPVATTTTPVRVWCQFRCPHRLACTLGFMYMWENCTTTAKSFSVVRKLDTFRRSIVLRCAATIVDYSIYFHSLSNKMPSYRTAAESVW